MTNADKLRTIVKVKAQTPATLALQWSDGVKVAIDLSELLKGKSYRSLRDP